ncbi:MAG: hypothetical protein WKF30_02080 [Pyrinomonadaceae bacterium]
MRHDASSDLATPGTAAPGTSPQQKPNGLTQQAAAPPPPPPPTGPAVKTAAGRVFYGGGGITPDIEVKPIDFTTPTRIRIVESAFLFTRELTAGLVPGLEAYRVGARQSTATPRATDYPVNERVLEAFRKFFVKRNPDLRLTSAQIDAEADIVKLRLREEIIIAAFGVESAIRTMLESDPQLLRAIDALPDARRLAEQVRMGVALG